MCSMYVHTAGKCGAGKITNSNPSTLFSFVKLICKIGTISSYGSGVTQRVTIYIHVSKSLPLFWCPDQLQMWPLPQLNVIYRYRRSSRYAYQTEALYLVTADAVQVPVSPSFPFPFVALRYISPLPGNPPTGGNGWGQTQNLPTFCKPPCIIMYNVDQIGHHSSSRLRSFKANPDASASSVAFSTTATNAALSSKKDDGHEVSNSNVSVGRWCTHIHLIATCTKCKGFLSARPFPFPPPPPPLQPLPQWLACVITPFHSSGHKFGKSTRCIFRYARPRPYRRAYPRKTPCVRNCPFRFCIAPGEREGMWNSIIEHM